ncbi:hypothetical protein [Algoriphagus chordae]|uniref:Uncharacterized protein n=1 Tax=Algoriphagus chordae TaxID=237019 RepID=A0A2W7R9R2_9BACT|nr:hypothetical protein [Algoriphagus chordae]PZX56801.1 hypothetical protein LV85_00734 [Algoriphagus chordae]
MKLLMMYGLINSESLVQGILIVQETHYDPWGVELSGLGYQYAEDRV